MRWRFVAFVAAALGGIVLYAVGGAEGSAALQITGWVVEIACLYVAWRWFARQQKPPVIKPAASPAWNMRDQPPPPGAGEAPPPPP